MLRKSLLALAILAVAPGLFAQSDAIPMPPDRAADSYAIYSVLMPGAPFTTMSAAPNQRWAIADTTVNIRDMNPAVPPEGQLKAPPDNVKAFHEAVRDYEVRKNQHVRLTTQFQLPQPYVLLTADQVAELRQAKASVTASSDLQARYAAYPGITFFSEVFFNAAHTAALVYINNWCATLCAQGEWVYLEKHGSNWVRRSGITEKGA